MNPTVPDPALRPARGTGARPSDTGHPDLATPRKQDQNGGEDHHARAGSEPVTPVNDQG
jgi:hypothetical protein